MATATRGSVPVKDEHEFYDPNTLRWVPDSAAPGVSERVLSAGPDRAVEMTRLARWAPGLDTTAAGVIRHAYYEEVYLLEGELEDLTLRRTFTAGHYASRPPGMPHGPYRTVTGCLMLEIRRPAG
ncbi:cupin domain-containing protein [Streptomyces sp. KK5PA1]|uniref:Cupin domain-containing protein n=2 Tax=Actinacidiphila acididurans TaxID=2784346 RepID=A0ABS2TQE5_9ACTN|nr:cupin domain-containing protein [Actinacidiphila acididurans]